MAKVIEYTKDQSDTWYFSDGYIAPAHIAVLHLAALRKQGNIVERTFLPSGALLTNSSLKK